VGVGLGIKKNQHGDFMIMDIVDGGAAALTSKVAVGDILQKVCVWVCGCVCVWVQTDRKKPFPPGEFSIYYYYVP